MLCNTSRRRRIFRVRTQRTSPDRARRRTSETTGSVNSRAVGMRNITCRRRRGGTSARTGVSSVRAYLHVPPDDEPLALGVAELKEFVSDGLHGVSLPPSPPPSPPPPLPGWRSTPDRLMPRRVVESLRRTRVPYAQ